MPGIRLDDTKSTQHVFFTWFPIARYLVFNKPPDDFHGQQIDLGPLMEQGLMLQSSIWMGDPQASSAHCVPVMRRYIKQDEEHEKAMSGHKN